MVAGGVAPFFIAVIVIIAGSFFIRLGDPILGFGICQIVFLRNPADPVFHTAVDIHADAVAVLLQRIIRTPSDDHAGSFIGNRLDGVELSQEDLLIDRHIRKGRRSVAEGISVHNQGIQETVGGLFIMILKKFLADTAVLGCPGQ